jgi:hypothetical protein
LGSAEVGRWQTDLPADVREMANTAFHPWLVGFGYLDAVKRDG